MRLMPSKNGVLVQRMPFFQKRMPLNSHVFGSGCPRMPSKNKNGCPRGQFDRKKWVVRCQGRMPRGHFLLQKLGHPLHSGMSASTTTSLNWTRRAYASGGGHDANMGNSYSHNAFMFHRIYVLTNMFRFARWKRFEV